MCRTNQVKGVRMKGFAKIAAVLVAMTLIAGACSKKSTTTAPTTQAAAPTMAASTTSAAGAAYTAHEFGIDGPATLPAGTKVITLTNNGAQEHEMIMVKVDDAHASETEEDIVNFVKTEKPNSPPPSWATIVGGVVPPIAHGKTGQAVFGDFSNPQKPTINPTGALEPGTYFFMCFVTDPTTKMPHAALGMVKKVTVS
jgi:hypothetical protein